VICLTVSARAGEVTTIAAIEGAQPRRVLPLRDGSGILVADNDSNRIIFIDNATRAVSTIAHSQQISLAYLGVPFPSAVGIYFDRIAFDVDREVAYVISSEAVHQLSLPIRMLLHLLVE
jgi:hypothetical protein